MATDFFRPSMVVNLTLRFDELLLQGKPLVGKSADELAKKPPNPLTQRLSAFPALLDGTDDKNSFLFSQTPKSASVSLNSYRQASQFSMTLDWRMMPIDPRLIRALGVEIHLGTVSSGQFARGIQGYDPVFGGRESVLRTRVNGQIRQDTLLMIGMVDEYKMSHSSTGSEISISGRDIRSLFIDTPMPTGTLKDIDVTKNIGQIVRQIINLHPFGAGIRIQIAPGEFPPDPKIPGKFLIPSPATKDLVTQFGKSTDGKKGRGNVKGDSSSMSMWDAITYLCFACGVIPHWIGDVLRLRPSRSLYSLLNANDPNVPTPFQGSQPRVIRVTDRSGNQDSQTRNFPLMVFGRDIETFDFSRKFSGGNAKVVEVTGVDPTSDSRGIQKVVKVRWPENPKKTDSGASKKSANASKVTPSGKEAQEDIFRYTYFGIKDEAQLREIAISMYEEISRGELEGAISTKSLSSFGGGNADADLLRVKPGTAVEFATDITPVNIRSPRSSVFLDTLRQPFEVAVSEINKLISDENLARAIVVSGQANPLVLTRFFRIKDVTYKWNIANATEVSFSYQNYVEARFDIDTDAGEKITQRVAQVEDI